MEEIKRCLYAGDLSDSACCTCDGITCKELHEQTGEILRIYPATICGGYQPSQDIVTQATCAPEVVNQIQESIVTPEEEKSIVDEPRALGVTTEIQITSSVSKEIRGQWYKVAYTETRRIPEGADIKLERQILWDVCNNEVDNQIKSIS